MLEQFLDQKVKGQRLRSLGQKNVKTALGTS